MPEECLQTNNNKDFISSLKAHETHFKEILNDAKNADCKIKYVAEYKNNKASVELNTF